MDGTKTEHCSFRFLPVESLTFQVNMFLSSQAPANFYGDKSNINQRLRSTEFLPGPSLSACLSFFLGSSAQEENTSCKTRSASSKTLFYRVSHERCHFVVSFWSYLGTAVNYLEGAMGEELMVHFSVGLRQLFADTPKRDQRRGFWLIASSQTLRQISSSSVHLLSQWPRTTSTSAS